jgi:hypothetical protein
MTKGYSMLWSIRDVYYILLKKKYTYRVDDSKGILFANFNDTKGWREFRSHWLASTYDAFGLFMMKYGTNSND